MDSDTLARLMAQMTILEMSLATLIRDASPQAKADIREELLAVTKGDRAGASAYGEAAVGTADRLLSAADLHRG